MSGVNPSSALHRFAIFTAVATLGLIGLGGLVTSHQAGMSVPDWPTTYGYNLFFFPISQWVGGIFYEHTHRLYAAGVGLLTSILAAWCWCRETQGRVRWAGLAVICLFMAALGHRGNGQADGGAAGIPLHYKFLPVVVPVLLAGAVGALIRTRGALRWMAFTAFFAVILQGLMGGMRVALYKAELGIFHATFAQMFLCLLAVVALCTSRWWQEPGEGRGVAPHRRLGRLTAGVAGLILLQLVLGATMRHQHAGLAVPDFPLAYGRVWPPLDEASIERANAVRTDSRDPNPITANHILVHMAHRVGALVVLSGIFGVWVRHRQQLPAGDLHRRWAAVWFGLVLGQALLGAATIWSNKAADIATLHVILGAASLVLGVLLAATHYRLAGVGVPRDIIAPVSAGCRVSAVSGLPLTVAAVGADHGRS